MVFSVAIDGPAGAGKGTIATYLSERFTLRHLDTGLLYREAARLVIVAGIDISDATALEAIAQKVDVNSLNPDNLRNEAVASVASQIAVVPILRNILTQKMQTFASRISPPYQGVILDGRDVATAVLPNADVKIFVTADPEVRALRRTNELGTESMEAVLKNIAARDARDSNRQTAPLQLAEEAVILDTTFMDIQSACEQAAIIVSRACELKK